MEKTFRSLTEEEKQRIIDLLGKLDTLGLNADYLIEPPAISSYAFKAPISPAVPELQRIGWE